MLVIRLHIATTSFVKMCKLLKKVFSRRTVVIGMGILQFAMLSITYTVQAPIYPLVAESKGISQAKYGFVFGAYEIAGVLFTLPLSLLVPRIGTHLVFLCGIALLGGCCLIFGSLSYISDPVTFLTYSFLLRIVESIGNCSVIIGALTILQIKYPDLQGSVTGWTESGWSLGMTVGPFIGGFLYDVGGFILPFSVIGIVFLIILIPSYFLFKVEDNDETGDKENQHTLKNIVKIPKVWLGSAVNAMAAISSGGFLLPTLEPYLRQFNISQTTIGAVFLCNGLAYVLSVPIWDYFSNKKKISPYILMIFSFVLLIIGTGMMGPIPWIPVRPKLLLIVLGNLTLGFASGGCIIPVFNQMLNACSEKGIPYTTETKSGLSGLFVMSFAIGNCVGPPVAGILANYYGFRITTLVVIGADAFFAIVLLCFACTTPVIQNIDPEVSGRSKVEEDVQSPLLTS